jgi:beta-N-acetylhexosaminidase
VAARATAFALGLQERGVGATAKHFPGLGGAPANTDDRIAVVHRTSAQLAHDRLPFARASAKGVDAIMVNHAIYPALGGHEPFSIDGPLVQRYLRGGDVRFTGVVITDSLNATGLRNATHLSTPQLCASAIEAGDDIALLSGSFATARACERQIHAALVAGKLTQAQIDAAALRVLELKQKLGLLPD